MSLAEDIKDLQKQISLLEYENSSLSQNMEDLLLINILHNQSVKAENVIAYLDNILEKLSILKAIPLIAVCKTNKTIFEIISSYSLLDNENRIGKTFTINTIKLKSEYSKPIYLSSEEAKNVLSIFFPDNDGEFEIALFPFELDQINNNYLLLIDNDDSGSRLKNLEPILVGFIQNLTVRIDNIKLNEDLKKFSSELEEKVAERTNQLDQLIDILNNEIEEKQKREITLKENEKIQSLIFNSVPLMMFLLDANLKVTSINQTGLNISKKKEHQLFGLQPGQILNCINTNNNHNDCGNCPNSSDCFLWNSIKSTLQSRQSMYKIDGQIFMGSHGNVFERNVLLTTEFLEIKGQPSVFVSIDDITERVQLEHVLKEKTSILLKAQELAKMGEFSYDIKENVFRISPALEKLLAYNKKALTIDEFISHIHENDRDEVIRIYKSALEMESRFSISFQFITQSDQILYLHIHAEIERDTKGAIIRAFGVVMDITEQKKAEQDILLKNYELRAAEEELIASNDALKENLEELGLAKIRAEEADTLKTAFLANMSHEIRTPMNAIMGFSELLDIEDMPFEKRQKFTKIIKDRSKDLMSIINDILDISRIESHTLKIVETKGNISDKLVEIKEFFESRNEEIYSKPITYELFNQLTHEQCFIETDFERIKQVLINLIDNAFKFTASGHIHLGCQLKDDKTLQFSLSDTGIGIPKDKHNVIFERFRQIEEAYMTRDFGGAGLGLSICKGILELMHGNIWVESELGKGSTFYFTLPYKPIHNKTASNMQLTKNSFDFKDKTILIVEDMDYNQAYLKELLEETNAVLLFASNGTDALEKFKTNTNIDIVLMDIRLPDIHGLDLTKRMLHERNGIKIIAQTAYASSDDKNKCFEAGCIDFISKPISQKGLLEMLSNYLNP